MSNQSRAITDLYLRGADRRTCLRPLTGDPEDYVVLATYDVVGWPDDAPMDQALGQVWTEHVKLGAALNNGVSPYDVMDARSHEMCEMHSVMFEGDSLFLREDFEKALGSDSSGTDILYVPDDELLDHAWGPAVLHLLAQHSSCGFIVVGVPGLLESKFVKEDLTLVMARCAKLEAMGFIRYPASQFFFLNRAFKLLPLLAHLALVRATEIV
jgi:hypothetical protein